MRRGGMKERAEAERACRATLHALGHHLARVERDSIAGELPEPLARELRGEGFAGQVPVEVLLEEVGSEEPDVEPAVALEHARTVCAVLGEAVGGEAKTRLAKLPPEIADLFEAPEAPPASRFRHTERERPLAAARASTDRPISESPDPAHPDSVAASENPHGDRKISTGQSPRTIADAGPEGEPAPKDSRH